MKDLLNSAGSLEHKTSSLISAALAAGGRNNVTVVLCQLAMATGHEQVGVTAADGLMRLNRLQYGPRGRLLHASEAVTLYSTNRGRIS